MPIDRRQIRCSGLCMPLVLVVAFAATGAVLVAGRALGASPGGDATVSVPVCLSGIHDGETCWPAGAVAAVAGAAAPGVPMRAAAAEPQPALDMAGHTALAGYEVVASTASVARGDRVTRTVSCPTGKRAVSGGATAARGNALTLVASGPASEGTGWRSVVRNQSAPARVVFTAVCVAVAAEAGSLP